MCRSSADSSAREPLKPELGRPFQRKIKHLECFPVLVHRAVLSKSITAPSLTARGLLALVVVEGGED